LLTVTLFGRFPGLREKAQQFPVGEALACQLLPLPKCSDLRWQPHWLAHIVRRLKMRSPGISTEFDGHDYMFSVHLAWQAVTNEGIARFHCENPNWAFGFYVYPGGLEAGERHGVLFQILQYFPLGQNCSVWPDQPNLWQVLVCVTKIQ
jgi:hypothetical protein